MSQATLQNLLEQEDIKRLREIILADPMLAQAHIQSSVILSELSQLTNLQTPALDLSTESIKQANQWLQLLQAHRDKITYYLSVLDTFEFHLNAHWSMAFNICSIQPSIEACRNQDQREAYIYQLFEELQKARKALGFAKKKLTILSDNIQNSFYNVQQQQRNLQLVTQIARQYGS